jgi:hypothetical protein
VTAARLVVFCAHPSCDRPAPKANMRTSAGDPFCTKHDGTTEPLVCMCDVAAPRPVGECDRCARPVIQLWPAARYLAAVACWPRLRDQRIDWSLRQIRGRTDGLDLEQLVEVGAA